jgi:hypothetical protein
VEIGRTEILAKKSFLIVHRRRLLFSRFFDLLPNEEPVKMEGKGIFDDLKRKGKKMVKKSVREGVDSLK